MLLNYYELEDEVRFDEGLGRTDSEYFLNGGIAPFFAIARIAFLGACVVPLRKMGRSNGMGSSSGRGAVYVRSLICELV